MTVERYIPQPQHEHHESLHPMRIRMETALQNVVLEKSYVPDKERQERIFDRIDWDVIRDEVMRDGTNGKQVRGKLFEMLIQADPEFGERTPLEKELLALAHNPASFGLEKELGVYRNPDMAFLLVEKEGGTEIIGVGESKLGLLNDRSFQQLSETGFLRGARALVDAINAIPDPEAHGLVEVAKARPIRIAPDFSQLLVVPANRNIEWKSTLINRREFSKEGREAFYELLEDVTRVRTQKAAFSTAEIGAMTVPMISSAAGQRSNLVQYSI